MEKENNFTPEQKSAAIENDDCASSLPQGTMKKQVGKITYIADLYFKEKGLSFAERLKRVLKADLGN